MIDIIDEPENEFAKAVGQAIVRVVNELVYWPTAEELAEPDEDWVDQLLLTR